MRNKLIFLAGVGVGFVLGARAGRERYDQLIRAAKRVRENPTVQEAAGAIQSQAGGLMHTAKDTVSDKLGHTRLGAKVSHMFGRDSGDPFAGSARHTAGSNGYPAMPGSDL